MSGGGYISEVSQSGRINSHDKVASLPFSLEGKAFTINVVPKADVAAGVITKGETSGLIVSLKTYQNEAAKNYPVYFHQETLLSIVEIPADAIDLATYDVYWWCGLRSKNPA